MLSGPSVGVSSRCVGPTGCTGPASPVGASISPGLTGGPVKRVSLDEEKMHEGVGVNRPGRKFEIDLIEDDLVNIRMLMPNGKIGEVAIRGATIAQIIADRCIEQEKEAEKEKAKPDEVQVGEGFETDAVASEPVISGGAIIDAARTVAKKIPLTLQNVVDPTKHKIQDKYKDKDPFELFGEAQDTVEMPP